MDFPNNPIEKFEEHSLERAQCLLNLHVHSSRRTWKTFFYEGIRADEKEDLLSLNHKSKVPSKLTKDLKSEA
jgi:hypothetical protein